MTIERTRDRSIEWASKQRITTFRGIGRQPVASTVGILFAILISCVSAHAVDTTRDHDITIEDYFTQATISSQKISPDGSYVAYSESRWQKSTNDRKSDLWVVDTATHEAWRLTSERAKDRSPQWAPDSNVIYFLGNRTRGEDGAVPYDGSTQVWRISITGGNPEAVTQVASGIERFQLAADGTALYYVTREQQIDEPWKALRGEFKSVQYGHGVVKTSRVWRLDLQNWRAEQVIDDGRVINQLALSPDGQRIAMITTSDGTVVSNEGKSRIDVFDADTGQITAVPDRLFRADAPSPYGWLEHLAWSGDSKRLAFDIIFDAYPSEVVVADWSEDEPDVYFVPRPDGVSLHGYGSPIAWRGDEPDVCFLGDTGGRVRLYCARGVAQRRRPRFEPLTKDDVVVSSFSFSADGRSGAAVLGTPSRTPDIYLVSSDHAPRPLTKVNPQMDNWRLPQMSTVDWESSDGTRVEGILELPPDYTPADGRLPLVVVIHGGPTTASQFQLRFWIYGRTLLPAKGYAVLCPNYRGSTGYGDRFLTDLVGRANEVDVEDILSGVDAMVQRGIADPDRMAVMGWSNGGYLTNCIISKSDRFQAAISGAGIVDATMQFAASDEPAYMIAFQDGLPWTNPTAYQSASSTLQLGNIRTPTLIHVGQNDVRCPPAHSRFLYRALRQYVQAPTELLVYPGEGHTLTSYTSRRAKMAWDVAWLKRYVMDKE